MALQLNSSTQLPTISNLVTRTVNFQLHHAEAEVEAATEIAAEVEVTDQLQNTRDTGVHINQVQVGITSHVAAPGSDHTIPLNTETADAIIVTADMKNTATDIKNDL